MNATKFDGLTQLLANRPSRREVVRGLTATLVGGIAVAGITHDAAACVDVGSSGKCNNDNDCCGDDAVCRSQRCQCKSGFRVCRESGKEQCFDLRNDSDHCGNCNRRCSGGKTCARGSCTGAGSCTITGLCGAGRPDCCAGFACRSGQPNKGLGGCVPA